MSTIKPQPHAAVALFVMASPVISVAMVVCVCFLVLKADWYLESNGKQEEDKRRVTTKERRLLRGVRVGHRHGLSITAKPAFRFVRAFRHSRGRFSRFRVDGSPVH